MAKEHLLDLISFKKFNKSFENISKYSKIVFDFFEFINESIYFPPGYQSPQIAVAFTDARMENSRA